jgi:predicted ATPase
MILHGIKARNFMSLRDCTISELDDHLNFLVGPNGSGNSTVFRTLKAIYGGPLCQDRKIG